MTLSSNFDKIPKNFFETQKRTSTMKLAKKGSCKKRKKKRKSIEIGPDIYFGEE
jgi:hypothetical protein